LINCKLLNSTVAFFEKFRYNNFISDTTIFQRGIT